MIVPVQPEDFRAIYEIYTWYVEHSTAIFDLEPLPWEDFQKQLAYIARHFPFYAAFHENQLIGYAYVHAAFTKKAYEHDVELTIYFRPGPHYGLAAPLYQRLEEECRKRKVRWIIACITDSNMESIHFHEKMGFVYHGFLPDSGLKFGQWHGVEWYCRAITPACEYLKECRK